MRPFSFRQVDGAAKPEVDDRTDDVSADLPYELQSKMFDQMATVGIAGAGLAVTLIGSTLREAPAIIWMSVILFGLAALTAISGNQRLVDNLSRRQPCLRRAKRDMQIATMLLGMAVGSLSMSVFMESRRLPAPAAEMVANR